MDNMDHGEQAPPEENASRAPRPVILEAVETDDGRLVVPAEGSVWQLYFPAGLTPTEDQLRVAIGPLGAVKTMQAGGVAYTAWDTSADGVAAQVTDFSGKPIIDAQARADCVANALRADKFNERVLEEAERLSGIRARELELEAAGQVQGFEQAAASAEQRAEVAESDSKSLRSDLAATLAEVDALTQTAIAAGLSADQVDAIRSEAREKSVLPTVATGDSVGDAGGETLSPSVDYTDTIHGEERNA